MESRLKPSLGDDGRVAEMEMGGIVEEAEKGR